MPTQNTSITEVDGSQPLLHQHGYEIQQYGTLRDLPIVLSPQCPQPKLCFSQSNFGRYDYSLSPLQETSLVDARTYVLSTTSVARQTRQRTN
ncbi:hypothetical protein NIES4072_70390 [Nostoc commune NIES-4072]|uniref:Uncharacterized protein n=1 Tax=Nostoc commune NIES-4072 TaxID=2005467 RepID=A0A2R5FX53_NOSCO|nr:hypothetical protein NIES4070_70830 [Nostoc commune HK-02]GBG23327.1 hypothetical protein NIES4072_70390 [Nostoc commune NIES-4072]